MLLRSGPFACPSARFWRLFGVYQRTAADDVVFLSSNPVVFWAPAAYEDCMSGPDVVFKRLDRAFTGERRWKARGRWVALMVFTLLLCVVGGSRLFAQQPLTGNLLVNPGAELGSLANWTPGGPGNPTVDDGTFDGGINPHTGSFDFLGHDSASSSLSQNVSVTNVGVPTTMIDSGSASVT